MDRPGSLLLPFVHCADYSSPPPKGEVCCRVGFRQLAKVEDAAGLKSLKKPLAASSFHGKRGAAEGDHGIHAVTPISAQK